MTRYAVCLLFILSGLTASASSQTFISPGVKVGYLFGDKGGLVTGIEISVVKWADGNYRGVVFDVDALNDITSYHVGAEFGQKLGGVSIGPVIRSGKVTTDFGLRVTPYSGLIVIPYYNFQLFCDRQTTHEIGAYVKFPFSKSGGRLFNVGG